MMHFKDERYIDVEDFRDFALTYNPSIKINEDLFNGLNAQIQGSIYNKNQLSFLNVFGFSDTLISQRWFDDYFGNYLFLPTAPMEDSVLYTWDRVKQKIRVVIDKNISKYIAILEMFKAEYNPIENYSMVEKGIDSESEGKLTDTFEQVGSEITDNYNFNSGSETDSETQNGNVVNTTWNSDIPYDNGAEMTGGGTSTGDSTGTTPLSSKTITQQTPVDYNKTNTLTYNDRLEHIVSGTTYGKQLSYDGTTISDSDNPRQDIRIIEHDNSTSSNLTRNEIDKSGNSEKLNGDKVNDHLFSRSGNIGVTTSQQMLEAEIKLKGLSILDTLFKDVNKEILLDIF